MRFREWVPWRRSVAIRRRRVKHSAAPTSSTKRVSRRIPTCPKATSASAICWCVKADQEGSARQLPARCDRTARRSGRLLSSRHVAREAESIARGEIPAHLSAAPSDGVQDRANRSTRDRDRRRLADDARHDRREGSATHRTWTRSGCDRHDGHRSHPGNYGGRIQGGQGRAEKQHEAARYRHQAGAQSTRNGARRNRDRPRGRASRSQDGQGYPT